MTARASLRVQMHAIANDLPLNYDDVATRYGVIWVICSLRTLLVIADVPPLCTTRQNTSARCTWRVQCSRCIITFSQLHVNLALLQAAGRLFVLICFELAAQIVITL